MPLKQLRRSVGEWGEGQIFERQEELVLIEEIRFSPAAFHTLHTGESGPCIETLTSLKGDPFAGV